jgi:hypothetical protein
VVGGLVTTDAENNGEALSRYIYKLHHTNIDTNHPFENRPIPAGVASLAQVIARALCAAGYRASVFPDPEDALVFVCLDNEDAIFEVEVREERE